jgi:2-methylfumaryl-CoA isomerase
VKAATGFPLITGPVGYSGPVNHVLPAWDVACGLYAALSLTAALRHRDVTGQGGRISLPLENVALATAGNLGFLAEAMVNKTPRERLGNSIFGQYGQDFTSSDGVSFMLVTLTGRHFRDLTEVTGTATAVAALFDSLDADVTDEGQRYRHRDQLTALFAGCFRERDADEITAALSGTSILWDRYRTFVELVPDERVTANSMFTALNQPRAGVYLAPGLPMSIDGNHVPAAAALAVGDDTAAVLQELLSLTPLAITRLSESGTVATTPTTTEESRLPDSMREAPSLLVGKGTREIQNSSSAKACYGTATSTATVCAGHIPSARWALVHRRRRTLTRRRELCRGDR